MRRVLRSLINKTKVFRNAKNKRGIIKFKKEIWQTDEIAKGFIKGSDASNIVGADLMDKEVNEFFLANCAPHEKVLDIGCGHGIVSEFLADNGIHVTAIDISDRLLNEFRERIKNKNLKIEIIRGDAYKIPCHDETFDVVVARMFLPHFPDWPVVLKEMARVTKKDGKLLVHFSSKENVDLGKSLKIKDCQFASSPDTKNPWNYYAETDDNELKKVCKKTGLIVVNRIPVSFFLHNRILGYQLGQKKYDDYMVKMQEYLKDDAVKNFTLWFDKEIIANCHPSLSHSNIIIFQKL